MSFTGRFDPDFDKLPERDAMPHDTNEEVAALREAESEEEDE